jgi:glycerol-3-phosphate O-acyltransferase
VSADETPSQLPPPRGRARLSLVERWFRPVQIPPELPEELSAMARQGSLVFVMRDSGLLNYLYIRWIIRRLRLPPLRAAVNYAGLFGWLSKVRRTRRALDEAVTQGFTALVFLNRPNDRDPFAVLAGRQRTLAHPVFLVPLIIVWSRRAKRLVRPVYEVLYGSPEAPTAFGAAVAFLRNYKRAFLRGGRSIDLSAFVRERAPEPDAVLGRKIRGILYHHLSRELRAAVGPPLKAPARVREKVMRDRHLRQVVDRVSRQGGRSPESARREAHRDLAEIASRYSPLFIEFLRPILGWMFSRIYDRIELDEEGLARLKRAASGAPLVLCPSHKSHIDYLILSYVFYENGMTPPHIAAGINLAFWPFGWIARRGGAFFIRRTFKGDKIYSATLRAYVKYLLREGFPQEFFLEGGRSRTGKMLFPKTGLFSMEVDAWLDGAANDVLFVPIAVDYERLVEARSYAKELSGGEKTKESFWELLRAPKILTRRYGLIYVQFGEPISLRALAEQRLGEAAASLSLEGEELETDSKRQLVRHLSNRTAYEIGRSITVTPVGLVAAVLLSHVRRGIDAAEVARRVELLRYIAANSGGRFPRDLPGAPSDPREPGPVADAVARLAADGLVKVEQAAGHTIYVVVDERRPLLDYYRNNVLHRYVALSLVACALRASGGEAPVEEVRDRTRWLSRLFKLEFMYRVGASFDTIFEENVDFLGRLGVAERVDGRLRAGSARETLDFLADLTRAYLEAYRLAAETAQEAERSGASLDRRSLVKLALERGRADFLSGHLALRESLSKASLENAFEWLSGQGAFAFADGRWGLDPGWRDGLLTGLVDEASRLMAVK